MFLELLFADQTNVDGDQSGFLVKQLYRHVKAHILSSTEVQTSVLPLNIIDGTDVEGEHAPCCRGPDGRIEPRVPHQVVECRRYVLSREEGQCNQSLDVRKRSCMFHILLLSAVLLHLPPHRLRPVEGAALQFDFWHNGYKTFPHCPLKVNNYALHTGFRREQPDHSA